MSSDVNHIWFYHEKTELQMHDLVGHILTCTVVTVVITPLLSDLVKKLES